ncbi:uncharacterized [Tachysurus ichikawai]
MISVSFNGVFFFCELEARNNFGHPLRKVPSFPQCTKQGSGRPPKLLHFGTYPLEPEELNTQVRSSYGVPREVSERISIGSDDSPNLIGDLRQFGGPFCLGGLLSFGASTNGPALPSHCSLSNGSHPQRPGNMYLAAEVLAVVNQGDPNGCVWKADFCSPYGSLELLDGRFLLFLGPVVHAKRKNDGLNLSVHDGFGYECLGMPKCGPWIAIYL